MTRRPRLSYRPTLLCIRFSFMWMPVSVERTPWNSTIDSADGHLESRKHCFLEAMDVEYRLSKCWLASSFFWTGIFHAGLIVRPSRGPVETKCKYWKYR